MVRPVKPSRITPAELRAYLVVMRQEGGMDFASGDTRIILDPSWHANVPVAEVPDLRPIVPQNTDAERRLSAEEEEIMIASVTPS